MFWYSLYATRLGQAAIVANVIGRGDTHHGGDNIVVPNLDYFDLFQGGTLVGEVGTGVELKAEWEWQGSPLAYETSTAHAIGSINFIHAAYILPEGCRLSAATSDGSATASREIGVMST